MIKIEIKYTNTAKDYRLAHKLINKLDKNSFHHIFLLMKILLITLIVYAIELIFEIIKNPDLIGSYFIFLICIFIGIVFTYNYENSFFNAAAKKIMKYRHGENLCKLDKGKLICTDDSTIIELYPKDIHTVIEKNNTIFILGANNILYLVIPNHAFKDIEQKNEFIQAITRD